VSLAGSGDEAVNAMLLNEFIEEHRQVQEQQKHIDRSTAQLKEQAALIQKVNDKIEMLRLHLRLLQTIAELSRHQQLQACRRQDCVRHVCDFFLGSGLKRM
jgi:hypothetical protein